MLGVILKLSDIDKLKRLLEERLKTLNKKVSDYNILLSSQKTQNSNFSYSIFLILTCKAMDQNLRFAFIGIDQDDNEYVVSEWPTELTHYYKNCLEHIITQYENTFVGEKTEVKQACEFTNALPFSVYNTGVVEWSTKVSSKYFTIEIPRDSILTIFNDGIGKANNVQVKHHNKLLKVLSEYLKVYGLETLIKPESFDFYFKKFIESKADFLIFDERKM